MSADQPNESKPSEPSKLAAPRRRMTKAEKETHAASIQNLEDEKKHRIRNTWIGGIAIVVTAAFSLASCAETRNEIQTMDRIAAQQQARDRDQLRLRCGEQSAETVEPMIKMMLALQGTGPSSSSVTVAKADPALLAEMLAASTKMTAICSAAGLTNDNAEDRFGEAMSAILTAAGEPVEDAQTLEERAAALVELGAAYNAYFDVDVTGMDDVFETETRIDEAAK
ncbi:hypothetical protein [Mycetocola sp. 2940]|uniref:hypothetical protein n=1 Tax=Mycetocola sp. 2940 TaxID=3156452 RepID=UPI00339AC15D